MKKHKLLREKSPWITFDGHFDIRLDLEYIPLLPFRKKIPKYSANNQQFTFCVPFFVKPLDD